MSGWIWSFVLAVPLLVAISGGSSAENFVRNGSFEDTTGCPVNFGQVRNALPWVSPITDSDLLHSCYSGASGVGTPANLMGSEPPFDGEAYVGLVAISQAGHHLEYLQSPLSAPLVAGRSYEVSFRVSLADSSGWATADLGALFREDPIYPTTPPTQSLPITPIHIVNSGGPILQKNGWTEIRGTYVADGTERFILIGNFVPYATTTANATGLGVTSGVGKNWAYYYVDDVRVTGCRGPETQLYFNDLAVSGPNPICIPDPHVEAGFQFGNGVCIEGLGDQDPLYTGTPALNGGGFEYWISRNDSASFDICSFEAAADPAALSPIVIVDDGTVLYGFPVASDAPVLETIRSVDLKDQSFWSLLFFDIQVDNFCLCPGGVCGCEPIVEIETKRFCVQGPASGVNWAWQLSGNPLVNATTPGALASNFDLARAFAESINADGPEHAVALIDKKDRACMLVTYTVGFTLSVGPENGPINCAVTANPLGCSFNPRIFDGAFVPDAGGIPRVIGSFALPLLGSTAAWILGVALTAFGAARLWRRRNHRTS
jgi:hypothetical protein